MIPAHLSKRFTVKFIEDKDTEAVLSLMRSNPQYFRHCPPEPSEETIAHDRIALPPRNVPEDKYYLGFWDGEKLAAVLDLIVRCPNHETAFIGFFMMDSAYQGKGIGSSLIEEILMEIAKEYRFVRLMVVITNEQAKHFWNKNHFQPTGLVLTQPDYTVAVLERTL